MQGRSQSNRYMQFGARQLDRLRAKPWPAATKTAVTIGIRHHYSRALGFRISPAKSSDLVSSSASGGVKEEDRSQAPDRKAHKGQD